MKLISDSVKIAHISDLHFSGKQDRRQHGELDRMLDYFVTLGYDHLVISGDLSNNADPEDWMLVRNKLERHGLYCWDKTTVVAGNHDLMKIEEEMRFYNALNPLSFVREKIFDNKLKEFCSFFQELIIGEEQGEKGFPFIKVINYPSVKIAFSSLNSVYPWYPADNPLGARGFINQGQLSAMGTESVLAAVKKCFVIGLCHHAYKVYGTDSLIDQAFDWTMELKNREEFLGLMKKMGAKLVLHGHFHRFQAYSVDGITFVNGGSFRYNTRRYSELLVDGQGSFRQQFLDVP